MIRKYILPIIAIIGAIFAFYSVFASNKPVSVPPPVIQPPKAPFDSYIAGSGIVEARSENIKIGTPVSGIVTDIYVKTGNKIKANDPLFKLDDRILKASLKVARGNLKMLNERLKRLRELPRKDDIPPQEARVKGAEVALSDLKDRLGKFEAVTDKRAISTEELDRRRFAVQAAIAKLDELKADLALLKAGAWENDIDILKAEGDVINAEIAAIETEIERLTVRSPIDGEILKLNIRLGEFAQAGSIQDPIILIGNLDKLHVRVDIDENDAWRLNNSSPAVAFIRGNKEIKSTLKYEYTEPYVIPKRSLTGDSIERVDTRVLQIIYSFDRLDMPIYAGQLMDIFIEARPVTEAGGKG